MASTDRGVKTSEYVRRDEKGELLLTTSDMLSVFNISQQTMKDWANSGCPKHSRGLWNIREVIRWRGIAKAGDNYKDQSDEARKLQADADYKHAKARQEEVRLQEMLGELVPIEMIHDKLIMTFTEIRQTLLKLPNDLRVAVHTQYPEASEGVTEIAEETVRKCLGGLAVCGDTRINGTLERTDRQEYSDGEGAI